MHGTAAGPHRSAAVAFGELTVYDRTDLNGEQEAINRIDDAEIALTNKTPITTRVIDACPALRFISDGLQRRRLCIRVRKSPDPEQRTA